MRHDTEYSNVTPDGPDRAGTAITESNRENTMDKEDNPMFHVNERDYPVTEHHCDDPEKKKLRSGKTTIFFVWI